MGGRRAAEPPISARAVVVIAVLLLGGLGVFVAFRALGDGGEADAARDGVRGVPLDEIDRTDSVPLGDDAAPVRVDRSAVPETYRIVYDSTTYAGGEPAASTEIISVERPFRSHVELLVGMPPGREPIGSRTSSFARFSITTGAEEQTLVVPPSIAGSDLRADVAVPEAAQLGFVERREVREVVGRACQVYRAGGPVSAGGLVPVGRGERGEYADVCVDSAGLLLEEVWVLDGDVVRRRVATDVQTDVAFPDGTFETQDVDPLTFDEGGGSTRAVDPESRPGVAWELPSGSMPAALEGFSRAGRFAVVNPRLEVQVDPIDPDRRRTAGIVDVWVRGVDVVFVDQGGSRAGAPPFDPHPHSRSVALGALPDGEAFLDVRMNEVRTVVEDGYFVRVYGTVPLDDLAEIARSLRYVEGGELRYVD